MDHYQIRRISIGPKLWWPPNEHHWAVILCILRDTVCSSEYFVNFHEYDPWATKIELAHSCWHAFSREFGSLWLISRKANEITSTSLSKQAFDIWDFILVLEKFLTSWVKTHENVVFCLQYTSNQFMITAFRKKKLWD